MVIVLFGLLDLSAAFDTVDHGVYFADSLCMLTDHDLVRSSHLWSSTWIHARNRYSSMTCMLCHCYADNTRLYFYCRPYQVCHLADVFSQCINSLDATSRYTDFAQTSLRRQKSVYRRHGMLTHAPEVGIPTAWCINASRQKSVNRLCFLMHTGIWMPES